MEVCPFHISSQSSFLDELKVTDFIINALLVCRELHANNGQNQYAEIVQVEYTCICTQGVKSNPSDKPIFV